MRRLAFESQQKIGDLPISPDDADAMSAGWNEARNALI
jgi:hypothetical protein